MSDDKLRAQDGFLHLLSISSRLGSVRRNQSEIVATQLGSKT
jgi:hypothetical protein